MKKIARTRDIKNRQMTRDGKMIDNMMFVYRGLCTVPYFSNRQNRKTMYFFRREVMKWWQRNKRDYPWRNNPTPYESMVAEMMLQKTPADRVCKVFNEFLTKFPDIYSLASAPEKDICSYFKQLGLVKRGLWLKKAATMIVENFKGRLPSEDYQLKSLPGFGEYTSNAVLIFSKRKRLTLLDANFKRLYSRFFGGELFKSESFLMDITPKRNFANFYYAVLDFSARICTSKNPLCTSCPLNSACNYFERRYCK